MLEREASLVVREKRGNPTTETKVLGLKGSWVPLDPEDHQVRQDSLAEMDYLASLELLARL